MSKKNIPYIFLLLLIIVLIFIGGVKYGRKVEETNKVIKYVLSITPTQTPPTPTIYKALAYNTYNNEYCGIRFLYPNTLTMKEDKETSGSATFTDKNGKKTIAVGCYLSQEAIAVILGNNKIWVSDPDSQGSVLIKTQNPSTKQKNFVIGIQLDKNLLPLIEKTIEFLVQTPTKALTSPSLKPTIKPSVTSIITP